MENCILKRMQKKIRSKQYPKELGFQTHLFPHLMNGRKCIFLFLGTAGLYYLIVSQKKREQWKNLFWQKLLFRSTWQTWRGLQFSQSMNQSQEESSWFFFLSFLFCWQLCLLRKIGQLTPSSESNDTLLGRLLIVILNREGRLGGWDVLVALEPCFFCVYVVCCVVLLFCCFVVLLFCCFVVLFIVLLLFCYFVILLLFCCYFVVLLLFCCYFVVILLFCCYFVVLLLFCCFVVLFYCFIVLLFYCFIILLFCCFVVLLFSIQFLNFLK